jgi:hypothetical protein
VLTKRAFSVDLGASEGGLRLNLASGFTRTVWLERLLPLLTIRETLILRTTCSAIRDIVAEMRADLDERQVEDLREMLTCFPKAERIILNDDGTMSEAEEDSLLAWLEEHGNCLTSIEGTWEPKTRFLRRAWRAGIFKSVEGVAIELFEEGDRDLVVHGAISHVKSVSVKFLHEEPHVEQAVLGFLRTLPAVTYICCCMGSEDPALPPFIPPSLGLNYALVQKHRRPATAATWPCGLDDQEQRSQAAHARALSRQAG